MDTVSIIGDDYFDEYFDEYKNLGGKKAKRIQGKFRSIFEETYDILLRVILNSTIQDKKLLKPL